MINSEVIAYTIYDRTDLKMVMDMMYSHQGWHYQHMQYQQTLKKYGITQSMSRKGNCLDNAVTENFFGIMKSELLYLLQLSDMDIFKQELRKYINYYNNDHIKRKESGEIPNSFSSNLIFNQPNFWETNFDTLLSLVQN